MAASKYLKENQHKRTIGDDADWLEQLDPFIGALTLRQVHMGSLQPFIEKRRRDSVKTRTINLGLATVRRILNLAAYPLSREEQEVFFAELPEHLRRRAVFKVNSGCREHEVCSLRWDWEVEVPEFDTSVFIVPAEAPRAR